MIDHTTTSVDDYVTEHTGGEGFDVVFDTVGGATLGAPFAAVRTCTGHVVSALGWGTHSLAPLSFRGATYSGVFTLLPLLTGRSREHHGAILREAAALADNGALKPVLDRARSSSRSRNESGVAGGGAPRRGLRLVHDSAVLHQASRGQGSVDQQPDVPRERLGGLGTGLDAHLGRPRLTALGVPEGDGQGLRARFGLDRRADEGAPEETVPVEGGRQCVEEAHELLARVVPGALGGTLHLGHPGVVGPAQILRDELLLGAEVRVQGRLGDAGGLDDLVDTDPRNPFAWKRSAAAARILSSDLVFLI